MAKGRVFSSAGRCNMVGFGQFNGKPGRMATYVKGKPKDYCHLVDQGGKRVARDDVWIVNRVGAIALLACK